MTTSEKLNYELEAVLYGVPWYGDNVYDILGKVSFETAFEKTPGAAHNIAEIVLHMLSWTEEVLDRMNGLTSPLPTSGDWPDVGAPDEQKWHNYVDDLKLVNVNLLAAIRDFPEDRWEEPTSDQRDLDEGSGWSYEENVNGLIQHHVYHAGQIAILNRIING